MALRGFEHDPECIQTVRKHKIDRTRQSAESTFSMASLKALEHPPCPLKSSKRSTRKATCMIYRQQRHHILITVMQVLLLIPLISRVAAQAQDLTPFDGVTESPTVTPPIDGSETLKSSAPSVFTTTMPTNAPVPTDTPSDIPSDIPSDAPSQSPTPEPSLEIPSTETLRFRQIVSVENGRFLTESEIVLFQGLYASYTINFAEREVVEGRIDTFCEVLIQDEPERRRFMRASQNAARSRLLQSLQLQVDYNMAYESIYTNVTGYTLLFQEYVNSNLEQVTLQMQVLGLNVSEAFPAKRIVVRPDPTSQPTSTPSPTTMEPSGSAVPSYIPSDVPSLVPSSSTLLPSSSPSTHPTENPSTPPPSVETSPGGSEATVITVAVVVAASILSVGLLVYYRKRKLVRDLEYGSGNPTENKKNNQVSALDNNWGESPARPLRELNNDDSKAIPVEFNPTSPHAQDREGSQSLVSNQSLLSAGNSIGADSRDEMDSTQNLADEFDQYKDQNLEKMRADVEGSLAGFDSMMSQALTRALIDDDDAQVDPGDIWGDTGNLVGVEIEASALAEVADWLKRKETPTETDRRLFMQEALNKMVASVRHGVLGPEEASRSIHECAALLGLQLATEIPVETLIVTGMRKTVTAADLVNAFSEFGEIREAAVAPNQRGFGILRFRSGQSVERAMSKFRAEEIVVQDVAVHVRLLRPGPSKEQENMPTGPAGQVPLP